MKQKDLLNWKPLAKTREIKAARRAAVAASDFGKRQAILASRLTARPAAAPAKPQTPWPESSAATPSGPSPETQRHRSKAGGSFRDELDADREFLLVGEDRYLSLYLKRCPTCQQAPVIWQVHDNGQRRVIIECTRKLGRYDRPNSCGTKVEGNTLAEAKRLWEVYCVLSR